MIFTYLKRLEWLIGLVLLQVLILNNIHIIGYATPFIYVYFILRFSTEVSRNTLLLWGFGIGLLVDIFSNTPGMHTSATVLLAFIRPMTLNLYLSRDSQENIEPSFKSMGMSPYIKYIVTCVFIHHAILLLIESFSFFDLPILILKIISSTVLTVLCIIVIEGIRR